MRGVFILLGLLLAVGHGKSLNMIKDEWEQFKLEHNKVYQDEQEDTRRLSIFKDRKKTIEQHNERHRKGEESYSMAVNFFADMLLEEIVTELQLPTDNSSWSGEKFIRPTNFTLPKSIDYRSLGAVTRVKDQKSCGSCWAFSATGSMEGQHFLKTGKLVSLSEQNLVDCDEHSHGCAGGWITNAFKYVQENNGINTEKTYPYKAKTETCKFNPKDIGATFSGFVSIETGSEEELAEAVATNGPVSVAIACPSSLMGYNGGVFYDKECGETLSHGVLVVGFGTDEKGQEYRLVKNSWGSHWGEHGYIRMARNKGNNCGISNAASYPEVSSSASSLLSLIYPMLNISLSIMFSFFSILCASPPRHTEAFP